MCRDTLLRGENELTGLGWDIQVTLGQPSPSLTFFYSEAETEKQS